ncbi:MAG: murein biosynthesis integral membrane protein MurJ [Egibacteraceae bacterium]
MSLRRRFRGTALRRSDTSVEVLSTRLPVTAHGMETGARNVAKNSLAVASWTAVSRITGFGRVVTIAAVLGPTYLGNTYQALNSIPNLTYEVLTGSLFVTLLVPPLVRHVDTKDRRGTAQLAGGFLGVVIVVFTAVIALVVIAGPLLLRVLSLGVGDPVVAASQRRVGWLLLVMLMPQVVLYAIAGTGAAVMNAHDRFALAAAAPAMENIGIIATLAAVAVIFGTGSSLEHVPTAQVQLLGWGTTAAVGLHAAVQWWGAHRAGVWLVPRPGWRNPEVRQIVRRAVPSLGYSGLNSLRWLAVVVVANRVPGGVVAFDLADNFARLPVALGARPVALALLPQLSRLFDGARLQRFRDELVRGACMTCFLVVPAAVAYAVLARPLAEAVSFGRMASGTGITLVAAALAALSLSVLGDSSFVVGTYGSYAQRDAGSPFRSMALRTALTLGGLLFAFLATDGTAVVVALGLVISAADLAGAWHLAGRVRLKLPATGERLTPALRRALAGSALMAGPAYLVAVRLPSWLGGRWTDQLGMLAAVLAGLTIFVGTQRLWRSPELAALLGGFQQLRGQGGNL